MTQYPKTPEGDLILDAVALDYELTTPAPDNDSLYILIEPDCPLCHAEVNRRIVDAVALMGAEVGQ